MSTTKTSTRKTNKTKTITFASARTRYAAKRDADLTKASKAMRGKLRAIARNEKHDQHVAVTKWLDEKTAGDGNRYPDMPVALFNAING